MRRYMAMLPWDYISTNTPQNKMENQAPRYVEKTKSNFNQNHEMLYALNCDLLYTFLSLIVAMYTLQIKLKTIRIFLILYNVFFYL